MKTISKITIGLAAAALLIVGCGEATSATPAKEAKIAPTISEESLGLRKTDLYNEVETAPEKTEYVDAVASTSTKFKRAFQDAPPMIPHSTAGMLPIKIGANQCIDCHMPDVASSVGATPIPISHFTNFRPHHKFDGKKFEKSIDNYKNEVSIKETNHLQGARYNCSQCHAPQSQGNLAVENTFEAVYKTPDGAEKSRWSGEAFTDELDTIKGSAAKVTEKDIKNADSAAGASLWTHH